MKWMLALLLLSGCAQDFKSPYRGNIDIEFLPHVSAFNARAGVSIDKLNTLTVVFSDSIVYPNVGLCFDAENTITISAKFWYSASSVTKEQLMFHELGHCLLHRNHVDDTLNGAPISMMFPYLMYDSMYLINREYYLNELFKGR